MLVTLIATLNSDINSDNNSDIDSDFGKSIIGNSTGQSFMTVKSDCPEPRSSCMLRWIRKLHHKQMGNITYQLRYQCQHR
jgi:hypothetical protein